MPVPMFLTLTRCDAVSTGIVTVKLPPMISVNAEPVAVAAALMTTAVPDVTLTIVEAAGIPVPVMPLPTSPATNAAVAEPTVVEVFVVVPSVTDREVVSAKT